MAYCDPVLVPKRRILLVSSSGGVLLDLLALAPWWRRHESTWVAVRAPDTVEVLSGEKVAWQSELRPARVGAVVAATLRAWRVLRTDNIEVVVSAGSGIAVPWFLAGRAAGIRSVWVTTYNVVGHAGLAARVCAGLASQVVVQHPHLLAQHRRAVCVGELY
jgi:UDP-N-acetylglucosamine:LPS N-acetylglucosamine transferase